MEPKFDPRELTEELMDEYALMSSLDNPHIAKTYEASKENAHSLNGLPPVHWFHDVSRGDSRKTFIFSLRHSLAQWAWLSVASPSEL